MSYCRFSDADIYLYPDCNGYINCMCCSLSKKVKTIFTTGGKFLLSDIKKCEQCNGGGCDSCMMYGDTHLNSIDDAINHVKKHRENGDFVPDCVEERLIADMDDPSIFEKYEPPVKN